jgi:hypothetical protein
MAEMQHSRLTPSLPPRRWAVANRVIIAERRANVLFRVKPAAELGTPLTTFGKARLELSRHIIDMPHLSKFTKSQQNT